MLKAMQPELIARLTRWVERTDLPDFITRLGIWFLCDRTARRLARQGASGERAFAVAMQAHPIAEHAGMANDQHYELPTEFFALALGPRRKYSACFYKDAAATLADAEDAALATTLKRADLADAQEILELGCGWGSFSLYMAEHLPNARITAVSNSTLQRVYIEELARKLGLTNLHVITSDMNDFATDRRFDRIVSVEMFEHMANWDALLSRVRDWLRPDGRLFVHIFTHRTTSYRFDHRNVADWIAQYFFTGGLMPSEKLIWRFPQHFEIEEQWRWSGRQYARTAIDWLANFDRNIIEVRSILKTVYGSDASLWERRWRLFYLATAGLFGHRGGKVWGVSHYRLKPSDAHHEIRAEFRGM